MIGDLVPVCSVSNTQKEDGEDSPDEAHVICSELMEDVIGGLPTFTVTANTSVQLILRALDNLYH